MNPPANWYPDPTGRHGQRYWDGEQWTEHVFTDGVQDVDPLEAATSGVDAATDEQDDAVVAGQEALDADADTGTDATDDTTPDGTDDLPMRTPGPSPSNVPFDDDRASAADEHGAELFADAGSVEAGDDVGRSGDEGDEPAWSPGDDEPADDAPAEVAREVEAEDVVASVREVADAPTEAGPPDFSDAFIVAPETVSRLVGRRAEEPAPQQVETPDTDGADAADETDDAVAPPGLDDMPPPTLDAPPPSVPAAAPRPADGPLTREGLGLRGDLVGGAFAEREEAGPVALQNPRLLRCTIDGGAGVVARQGTMVAYQGDVAFERQGAGGVTRALKRAATGEGLAMMRVTGSGDVFFADTAQHVFLVHLDGGPGLSVNGRNVLAFSAELQWDIERVKGATLLAGGLFNTMLTGTGWVALVSDGEPVVLRTDEAPTYVDVNALVAWSGGLGTRIVNTVSAKSLVGLGSGEAFQMAFDGAGIVIVQPSEGMTGAPATA